MADPEGVNERRVDLAEQLLVIDEHIVAQIAEVAMLRAEVQTEREERRTHGRRIRRAVVAVAVVVVVVAVNVRWNQQSLREQRNVDRIMVECLTPDDPAATDPALRVHECYNNTHPTTTPGRSPGQP